ncbi:hypothetical protein Hanom_Chr17g01559201 [Helianthus anomalus]
MYKSPFWLISGRILSQVKERNKRERELEKEGWPVVAFGSDSWWPVMAEVVGVVRFNLEPVTDATNAMVSSDFPKSLFKVVKIV